MALAGAAVATVVGRATGAGWPAALGLAALLAVGLYLWARDEDKGWGDLGQGIMVSVVVAIALLAVQRDAEERTREASEQRDDQLHDADVRRERQFREADANRQKAAARENLQLALTMQSNLEGIALPNRDLRGVFLARKNLNGASLQGATLEGADLRESRLRQANLVDADLDRATLNLADLRGGWLGAGPLAGDSLNAPNLPGASLQQADLEEADLRGAVLKGANTGAHLLHADLRGSRPGTIKASDGPWPAWAFDVKDGARFRNAILVRADFQGAELAGADFSGAKLGGARFCRAGGLAQAEFRGAIYDKGTRWPPGFDPTTSGAKRVRGGKAREYWFAGFGQGGFEGNFPRC